MPKVVVKYMLNIRELVWGRHQETLEISGPTLMDLLSHLTKGYGSKLEEALFNVQTGRISSSIIILVNGREARFLDGLETKLNDGDEIVIVPPAGGG